MQEQESTETAAAPMVAEASELSLSAIQAGLKQRGIDVHLSALSELMRTGEGDENVGAQLGMTGGANRKSFPPVALDTLADWWPIFQDAGGRRPIAPGLLKRYLASDRHTRSSVALTVGESSFQVSKTSKPPMEALQMGGDALALLARLVVATEARAVPSDRLVGSEEAAQALACAPTRVSHYVRPVRRGAWRWSDIQNYIAGLQPQARRSKGTGEQA